MDQVSRPLLIALGATVALFVVWLVALRPGAPPADPPAPAPTQATGQAGNAAAEAPRRTAAPAAPAPSAARSARSASPPAAPAAPATATASRGTRDAVLRDVRGGKVVVMLIWNVRGADDRATHAAVAGLDRRGGKVAVHVVPVSRVGDYPTITQGVTISQSPTTLVIGRDRRARVIAGLSERRELSQAVGDALARR